MKHATWIAAGLLAVAAGGRAAETAGPAAGGGPRDPAEMLRAGHPRLWLLEDRLAELKARAAAEPTLARHVADVLAAAAKSKKAIPRDHKLIGPRLLMVSRDYLHHLGLLAFAYRWTGDRAYADAARGFMLKACAFKDWNPSHFLDTAEMTCAMAIGYDWTYAALDADTRRTIEGAMLRLGLEPGLRVYERGGWWAKSEYNWNQVCNGGMLAGALALGDVAPEPLRVIVPAAVRSLPRALASYAPDGSWGEGPGYWTYATDYTAFGLDALQTALGTDFGLGRTPGLSKAGRMPMCLVGPTGLFFNYADCGENAKRRPMACMFWLARKFGDPAFAEDEHAALASGKASPWHIVWYPPARAESSAAAPLDMQLRGDVPVAVFRSAWNDPNALWVAVKAGHNTVNHAHLDLGQFVLDALGVRWVTDLGSDDYDLPGYFGGQRWSYYRLNGFSHSIPQIGDGDQDPKGRAVMTGFHSGGTGGQAVIDLTGAYGTRADRVLRGVALTRNRRAALVQDEFRLTAPAGVAWGMTTYAEIRVDGPRKAVLRKGGREMIVQLAAPETAAFAVESGERPKPEKTNAGCKRLVVRVPGMQGETRIAVLFSPVWPDGADDDLQPLLPLDGWRGGAK